jgi:hypothetical protein
MKTRHLKKNKLKLKFKKSIRAKKNRSSKYEIAGTRT